MLDHKTQIRIVETDWGYFGVKIRSGSLCQTCLPLPNPSDVEHYLGLDDSTPSTLEYSPQLNPALTDRIQAYYRGEPTNFLDVIPLDLSTFTPFGQAVLQACHRLSYSETNTYGQLAQAVQRPGAARAVGQIMARNPIPLIIPCHRVIAANHKLGGFSGPGGITAKQRMLSLENSEN